MPSEALHEIIPVRQVGGEPRRRWFSAADMDLIVWYSNTELPVAFQLCYDRLRNERAITWREGSAGLAHRAVDDGEGIAWSHKATPILIADGVVDLAALRESFLAHAVDLPAALKQLVLDKLTPG